MIEKKRGRPRGTSPNRKHDEDILLRAAYLLIDGSVRTPTEAFRVLIGLDNESVLRRLQRRWKQDGDNIIRKAQIAARNVRSEFEAKVLEREQPEFFDKLKRFLQSEGGAAVIRTVAPGRNPDALLSLSGRSMISVFYQYYPEGPAAADYVFDRSYAEWCRYGCEPDHAFLERIAEICLTRVREERSKTGDSRQSKSEGWEK